MKQSTEKYSGLLNQLKKFGLNPKDWKVRVECHNSGPSTILTHREDPDLQVYGPCKVIESRYGLELDWELLSLRFS